MRQILIEKYINPSEIDIDGIWVYETWLDKYGYRNSFMGQPAEVYYYNGKIANKFWLKNGELDRDKDLPTAMWYYDEKMTRQFWHKKGSLHRDNGLPAEIWYDLNGKIECQHWFKKGQIYKIKKTINK
jgi:antitoxin component YwqK of YwqJK toxin-antitoxin module